MGNFAENLNLGNRFRPPPRGELNIEYRSKESYGQYVFCILIFDMFILIWKKDLSSNILLPWK